MDEKKNNNLAEKKIESEEPTNHARIPSPPHKASHNTKQHTKENVSPTVLYGIIGVAAILILFNWVQIWSLSDMLAPQGSSSLGINIPTFANNKELAGLDVSGFKNTAQSVNALFPLKEIKTADDAIKVMIPSGTPSYGAELSISYDDPVTALNFMAKKLYPAIKTDLKKNSPELWQRYLNLATKPVGISCEYCCGVGPVGITAAGELTCGCSHNPAIHALTMYLMKNTKMSDAEILQEALKWKSLWFPKNMVGLALQLAGGDTSALKNVPGMVGGC